MPRATAKQLIPRYVGCRCRVELNTSCHSRHAPVAYARGSVTGKPSRDREGVGLMWRRRFRLRTSYDIKQSQAQLLLGLLH
jgi:hypothetical protein